MAVEAQCASQRRASVIQSARPPTRALGIHTSRTLMRWMSTRSHTLPPTLSPLLRLLLLLLLLLLPRRRRRRLQRLQPRTIRLVFLGALPSPCPSHCV